MNWSADETCGHHSLTCSFKAPEYFGNFILAFLLLGIDFLCKESLSRSYLHPTFVSSLWIHQLLAGCEDDRPVTFAALLCFTLPIPFLSCAAVLDGHWGEPHTHTYQSEARARLRSTLAVANMKSKVLDALSSSQKILGFWFGPMSLFGFSLPLSLEGANVAKGAVFGGCMHIFTVPLSFLLHGPLRMTAVRWLSPQVLASVFANVYCIVRAPGFPRKISQTALKGLFQTSILLCISWESPFLSIL